MPTGFGDVCRNARDRAASRAQIRSRESKWRLYERICPPRIGERVLDVGVSHTDDLPGENFFLKNYPYPAQLTAAGIDDLSGLGDRYPGVNFVEADGRQLPFADNAFDVVHSNAVVEHVGARGEQEKFIAELARVGRAAFITTPNRWFPIETHSKLPLLHWLPRRVVERLVRALDEPNLGWWLLGPRDFAALFGPTLKPSMYSIRWFGWPLSLVITCQSEQRPLLPAEKQ